MRVIGAHHTGFTVSDLERSLSFYVGLLGCELLWRRDVGEAYFCEIVGLPGCRVRAAHLGVPGSGHVIELFEYVSPRGPVVDSRPNNPGHSHFAFVVEDLRTAYEELRSEGVRFTSPPVFIDAGVNKGGYGAYAMDPDGLTVELFQPPKGGER